MSSGWVGVIMLRRVIGVLGKHTFARAYEDVKRWWWGYKLRQRHGMECQ